MHLAKGLEFRAVAVIACGDVVIPSELSNRSNTERHLLYVACTRARDYLLVTGETPCLKLSRAGVACKRFAADGRFSPSRSEG